MGKDLSALSAKTFPVDGPALSRVEGLVLSLAKETFNL
jgi:hypothetical protein